MLLFSIATVRLTLVDVILFFSEKISGDESESCIITPRGDNGGKQQRNTDRRA